MSPSRSSSPSPYGRQVGASIAALLRLFRDRVPDSKSNQQVLELTTSRNWTSAHRVRSQVRDRYLRASEANDRIKSAQYLFEESCLETLYNDTCPDDPFDSISPYWVVPNALGLAQALSLPVTDVVAAMIPAEW
jgi:hypothetical protein